MVYFHILVLFHVLISIVNVTLTSIMLILPIDFADSTAKYNMLLAIPWRRADLATHKFAI